MVTSISIRRPVLFLLLLLAAGCADLPGLFSLRSALNKEYPDTPIGVRLTDESLLTVTLADSALQHAPCERRVGEAIHVAALIREHYQGFSGLRLINVEFASSDRNTSEAGSAAHFPIRFEASAIASGLTDIDSTRAAVNCKTLDELQ